jgi:hypothetical protein
MMPSQTYLLSKIGARRVQPPPRECLKVTMDKVALRELRNEQRQKTEQFQTDLTVACKSVDETVQTLATKHHKSVRCVENELHFGHLKFHSKREKINSWNTFCWDLGRRRHDTQANRSTENGVYSFFVGLPQQ